MLLPHGLLATVALNASLRFAPSCVPQAKPEKFQRYRAVEIKHGRIAMMATTGYIAQECLSFPGYLSKADNLKFADIPNGIKGLAAVPPLGLAQILLFIGVMEVATWRFFEGSWPGTVPAGKAPGDVAGELWVRYSDPEEKATKLNIELNNGRAAMMGITGMLMHDHITGSCAPAPPPALPPAPPPQRHARACAVASARCATSRSSAVRRRDVIALWRTRSRLIRSCGTVRAQGSRPASRRTRA